MKTRQKLSRRDVLTEFRTGEILDAAIELVNLEGMERLTMERLAERAGIAKGTIYLYFKDKEHLIATLLRRVMMLMLERLSAVTDLEGTLRQRLRRLTEELHGFSVEHSEFFHFVHQPSGVRLDVYGKYGVDDCRDELMAVTSRLFLEAMERGEIREADPELLGLLFMRSLHAVLIRHIHTQDSDVMAEAEFLIDLFFNGISSSGGQKDG